MLELAKDAGVLKLSGSWYSYEGEQLGQGEANTLSALAENPELFDKIRKEVGV